MFNEIFSKNCGDGIGNEQCSCNVSLGKRFGSYRAQSMGL